ncbi:MAG: sensor histidine kinase [Candidatus Methylomirabilales bacterium]
MAGRGAHRISDQIASGAPGGDEWSFLVLRALAMLGGMVALFLVPLRPEHQPHLAPFAWAFVAYKALLFGAIWRWSRVLRGLLYASIAADLVFIALFVWHTGGAESHFYLLFYLLVALVAVHFPPAVGLLAAAGAGLSYAAVSFTDPPSSDWHHMSARVATLFLLSGSLGYLSQRERLARERAERLNAELREHQRRLERAYDALKAAQEQLVRAERLAAVGQMSAKVSHEVRNPLSSISLNAELLEDELEHLPPERAADARSLMAAIRSQLDVLTGVTEEYLRFARLPKPKPEPTEPAALLHELVEFVRPELTAKGVRLDAGIEAGLPTLQLDPGQIRQVLLNLIRNGVEAMPGGGSLRLVARRLPAPEPPPASPDPPIGLAGRWVEVAVHDTGRGVAPADAERIFEPFFTTKDGGTGLGLPIARQIAADHGGHLVWQPAPGGGSIFRLVLPVPGGTAP